MGDALIGAVIADRYRVTRKLGQGGMGSIYEVIHVKLKRSFVLKRLAASLAGNDGAMMRFQREAEVVASLRHPNIVEISDWETLPDDTPCMILEYLRGEDLGDRIERGPLAWPDILRIMDQAMSALGVAHRAGVTHRDLKPHNIFLALDDAGVEHVKLLDFGISKIRDQNSDLTSSLMLIGTPAYMSPEQAHGRSHEIGPATDVWSMGAILYEMVTGRPPFTADSIPSTLLLITTTPPDPILAYRPDAPANVVSAIEDALSLDPERRIRTIDDLRSRLDGVVAPTTAPPPSRPRIVSPHATTLSHATGQATIPGAKRRWWIAGAAGAAIAGVAAFAIVSGWSTETKPEIAHEPDPPKLAVVTPDASVIAPASEIAIPAPKEDVDTPKPPPPPTRHVIHVVGLPAGSVISLDGKQVRGTTVEPPDDGKHHRLQIRAPGYELETRQVDRDTPSELPIKLRVFHHPDARPDPPNTDPKPLAL